MTAGETRADGEPVRWTFPGKYISVTTYKRDGTGVATPVWFVQESDRLLFQTGVASGKAKRIRRNPAVLVAACTSRGELRGQPVSGVAQVLSPAAMISRLLTRPFRGLVKDNWAMATTDDHAVTFTAPEVILFSGDVERAAEFYKRLGFAETFRVPQDGTPIHVDLELDGYKIGFAAIDSARQDHGLNPVASGQRATITLWTPDTAKAYRTLTARGVPALAEPSVWLGRLLIAWVQDPDGHPVQLVQRFDGPSAAPPR
jgi:PPOX class probable F420-dependent enzyme